MKEINWDTYKRSLKKAFKGQNHVYDAMLDKAMNAYVGDLIEMFDGKMQEGTLGDTVNKAAKMYGTPRKASAAILDKYGSLLIEVIKRWDIRCHRSLMEIAHERGWSGINIADRATEPYYDDNGNWVIRIYDSAVRTNNIAEMAHE